MLRASVRDESVDLVYLDPPFNSNAGYNILFAPPKELRTAADADNAQIRAFEDSWHSTMEREKAPIGIFITKALPTSVMEREAAAVGRFEDGFGRTYARLQILTLAELFQGKKPDIPLIDPSLAFRRAGRERDGAQHVLI